MQAVPSSSLEYVHIGGEISVIITVLVLYAQYRIDKRKEAREARKEKEETQRERDERVRRETQMEGRVKFLMTGYEKQQAINEKLTDLLSESKEQTSELKTQTAVLNEQMVTMNDRVNRIEDSTS